MELDDDAKRKRGEDGMFAGWYRDDLIAALSLGLYREFCGLDMPSSHLTISQMLQREDSFK